MRAREQPPRARGRRSGGRGPPSGPRATPAGAGTTGPAGGRSGSGRSNLRGRGDDSGDSAPNNPGGSNPRGRGDDDARLAVLEKEVEQPPRARGRHDGTEGGAADRGATPAGAGTTSGRPRCPGSPSSNPRGRGDDWAVEPQLAADGEQPPRARGRRSTVQIRSTQHRATPAGAGTTRRSPRPRPGVRSNPRGRGDDVHAGPPVGEDAEQPPRARGRRQDGGGLVGVTGATPAGAGTTTAPTTCTATRRSNPHGRGDDRKFTSFCCMPREQPPRARGRHATPGQRHAEARATPAGAGTTMRTCTPTPPGRSNPRGRGDDVPMLASVGPAWEQPPRARGRPTRPRASAVPR